MTARPPIPAATVILVRGGEGGPEVFLLKRHRASSFMSSAFVFPGGRIDTEDESAELAAVRELFEEAGVLLTADAPADLTEPRRRLLAGEISFADVIAAAGVTPDLTRLHWWARWVTPSAEPKRFDAQFFVAELPPGQTPSFDRKETVEELWIGAAEALARQAAGALRLPPPQLRTLIDLRAAGDLGGILAASATRQASPVTICPRIVADEEGISIVFPWDPGYASAHGEGEPIAPNHVVATPPSRLRWSGDAWKEM